MSDEGEESTEIGEVIDLDKSGLRGKRERALALARRVRGKVTDARESDVGQWLEARARDAIDVALRPESARALQSVMVTAANFGLEQTKRIDPDAALLFEFLDWLEVKHGRDVVARTFADHTPVLRPSWLELVAAVANPTQRGNAMRNLEVVRADVVVLLGELASLEHPDVPPDTASELVDYFESDWIPARFVPLAERLAGQPRETTATSGSESKPGTSSAIARFLPTLADPTVGFVVSSLLAVSNAYLGREVIERFPEMIELMRTETSQ